MTPGVLRHTVSAFGSQKIDEDGVNRVVGLGKIDPQQTEATQELLIETHQEAQPGLHRPRARSTTPLGEMPPEITLEYEFSKVRGP